MLNENYLKASFSVETNLLKQEFKLTYNYYYCTFNTAKIAFCNARVMSIKEIPQICYYTKQTIKTS